MAYTTIDDPLQYFNTVLYTGNAADGSSTTQDITGVGFQPDWVWLKGRNNANNHVVDDSVRGANKHLFPDLQNAENTSTEYLKSFASDGFQLGGDGAINGNGNTYVAWNWLAGGSASSNSNGSITSSVSANTTAGFSIVSYTGTTGGASSTIGHGLGVTPDLVILKPRSYTGAWWWAQKGRSNKVLELQNNNAEVDPSSSFGGGGLKYSTFTSTVFGGTDGTSNDDLWNTNGATYIAYCFAEKKGYSKIGSYTGNGNANGTFVYTGFRPAWVITKNIGSSHSWWILDNKRDALNPTNGRLVAEESNVEDSAGNSHDFLSNGFKLRTSGSADVNGSGDTMVYMAFAESPFVNSSGIPCNAR